MCLTRMIALAACCRFSIFIGSFLYQRAKSPQWTVLFINLLGKGLTWWAPVIPHEASSWVIWLIRVSRLIKLKGWRQHGPSLRCVYLDFVTLIHRLKLYHVWIIKSFLSSWSKPTLAPVSWDPFLKSPITFRAYLEWHNSFCNFKTETFQGTKLCKCFYCFLILKTW